MIDRIRPLYCINGMSNDRTQSPSPKHEPWIVLFIFLEWTVFGLCHFFLPEETARQVPPWIPIEYRHFVGVTTGMAEVSIGILILIQSTRRWAAMASITLLLLYIPAVYHILAEDSAVNGLALRIAFRIAVIPNNIFLIYLAWQLAFPRKSPSDEISKEAPSIGKEVNRQSLWERIQLLNNLRHSALLVSLIMMTANLAGLLAVWLSPWRISTGCLWGIMCLAGGALIGFLFAVPRINRETLASNKANYRPNSNIEDVSDWLSKTIVGVGLVEIKNIVKYLQTISSELGKSLLYHPDASQESVAASFAQALILYFFFAGIIQGYLLTRIYLNREFANADGLGHDNLLSTGKKDIVSPGAQPSPGTESPVVRANS